MSASTLAAHVWARSPARNPSASRTPDLLCPRDVGVFAEVLRVMKRELEKAPEGVVPCEGVHAARRPRRRGARSRERARGLFFQTMRTLSGRTSRGSRASVGSARAQNGHWKSANSTIVTGAVRLPQVGSLGPIGTPASSLGRSRRATADGRRRPRAAAGAGRGGSRRGRRRTRRRQTKASTRSIDGSAASRSCSERQTAEI